MLVAERDDDPDEAIGVPIELSRGYRARSRFELALPGDSRTNTVGSGPRLV